MIKLLSCHFILFGKTKGDMMARMLGDVNEVQNSFLYSRISGKEPLTIILL
jgi:hypothetical protein